ncbi:MAG: hypothetical protein IPJ65_15510 [Archangiaceae bacterium]|nr:hypothetical protein [Archangiaceae bacterium]
MARALMRTDADLMVLDEPASGLDAAAEVELNALLTHRSLRTTRVLISHRLSSIRGADQIAVLSEGRITERGSHDQLMVRGAAYARLFRAQAARYQDARVAAGAS